eukprot:GEZU01004377.1.p1 GENE.GEZU01004377.1~~GEZU01004377.1.p1  ORF type:complete len:236 (-),score=50.78 GEZU01004377.1:551-1258(-)
MSWSRYFLIVTVLISLLAVVSGKICRSGLTPTQPSPPLTQCTQFNDQDACCTNADVSYVALTVSLLANICPTMSTACQEQLREYFCSTICQPVFVIDEGYCKWSASNFYKSCHKDYFPWGLNNECVRMDSIYPSMESYFTYIDETTNANKSEIAPAGADCIQWGEKNQGWFKTHQKEVVSIAIGLGTIWAIAISVVIIAVVVVVIKKRRQNNGGFRTVEHFTLQEDDDDNDAEDQ